MNLGAAELLIILFLGGITVAAFLAVKAASGSGAPAGPIGPPTPVVVAQSTDQLLPRIVQLLVQNGALVTAQTPTSVVGHVVTKKKPSVLVAILLWFICIIPMVIYLVNGSKDVQEPFSLSLTPVPGGTRVEGGGTGRGSAAAHWVLSQLGDSTPVMASALTPGVAASTEAPEALPILDQSTVTPAGWYADPSGGPGLRWWDGIRWTDHLHDA